MKILLPVKLSLKQMVTNPSVNLTLLMKRMFTPKQVAATLLLLISVFVTNQASSQQGTQTFNSSGTFTVPVGVTQITVKAWGGGGAGGTGSVRSGGGGGAYATKTFSVTSGTAFTVTIGAGGTVGSSPARDGKTSSFGTDVIAVGGTGASMITAPGVGGQANACTPVAAAFSGGNGGSSPGTGGLDGGGGGGGSATSSSNGGNGGNGGTATIGCTAGAGGIGQGNGGIGEDCSGNSATAGSVPGGGGGGRSEANLFNSGNGAAGQVIVTYTCPAAAISYSPSSYCSNGSPVSPVINGSMGGTFSAQPNGLSINPSTGVITPSSSTPGTYTVRYQIVSTGGCPAVDATATVTVFQAVGGTVNLPNSTVCSGQSSSINVIVTPATGGTFSGTFTNGRSFTNLSPAAGVISPTYTFINNGVANVVENFTLASLTYTDNASGVTCSATSTGGSTNITIQPVPDLMATLNTPAILCNGGAVSVSITNPNLVGGTYNRQTNYNGAGHTAASTAVGQTYPGSFSDVLTNTTASPITVVYTFTPISQGSPNCQGTPVNVSVTVNPNPTVTCPASPVVSTANNACTAVVNGIDPVSSAPATCSGSAPVITYSSTGATILSGSGSASGQTFNKGITTVTYTITDALNNTGTCQFTVTVNDTQAPAITCPATVSVNNTTGQCGAIVNYPAPATATDNCPGAITITYSPASGTFFLVGTTAVMVTAKDIANNTSTCTFNVVVADNEAPAITCPTNINVNNASGQCGAAVTFAATATDNCTASGNINFSYSPVSGSVFPVGTTTVTATATDAAGNASTCQFTVTVADNEAPVISCPSTVTANNGADGCTAVVNYPSPATATDNCTASGNIQFTYSPASGSTFNVGITPVTVTATDAAGNFSTCTFNVVVNNATGNLYVNDGSTAGDTLTTAVGDDINGNGTKCKPFRTINKAIATAATGNTIYVDAGIYPEYNTVAKSLVFIGAKAGGDPRATGIGARPGSAGESIIVPPVVDTTNAGGTLFTLSANNISFDGFTFNGNNPSLTGGQPVNGVDIQASRAFINLQSPLTAVNNISVKNNVLKNFYRTGFYLQGVGPSAPQQNNVVDKNVFDNIHRFSGTASAVYLEQESTTDVTNNLMTRVGRGAFTATISGNAAVPFSFSNNNITSYFTGIWVNNHYGATPVCTIANNTLATESGAASNDGIRITSMQTSAQVLVNNNTITPSRYGYYLWNCPTTSTIILNGGSVTGGIRGVNGSNIYPGFGDASPSSYIVDNVTIQNSTTAGIYVDDNNTNTNNAAVAVTIRNGTLINNATTGLLISGANASAAFSMGTPPAAFTGQAKYIVYTSNGSDIPTGNIDATAVTFDGQTGGIATLAQNFAIEDKIDHKIDLATSGFVLVKANNTFVTTNSFATPNTTASVQRGVDVASTGFTVNLANGVYNGDVDVNKTVIVRGQSQAAVIRGLYAGNSKSVRVSASNATVKNVTITRDYGTTLPEWYASNKTEGIIIENVSNVTLDSALVTGNRNGIYVHSVPGFVIKNSIIRDNRTGFQMFGDLSSGQIINNFITNNFTHGILINFDQGPTNAQNLAVNNNNISGNWYSQIDFQNGNAQGTNVGNFTGSNFNCNWYGTVNPDYAAVNAGGQGYTSQVPSQFGGTDPGVNADIRGKEAALITYIPYLTSGADNNAPDSLNGFNPAGACNGTPVVITSAVPQPETCGNNNGSIVVTFTGGTGPYSLSYTGPSAGGPTTVTSPAMVNNLAAGTYNVTITDANGIFATAQAIITYNPVTNVTQNTTYTTIQGAVTAANVNDSITVCSGTYNEQVSINKSLKLQGLGPVKPVINYTGTPAVAARATLFDVTAPVVTIRGFEFRVNMTRLGSAIIASAADVSNLTVQNNDINPYQSTPGTYGPGYGLRNAVAINYAGLRVAGASAANVLATGNTITYFDNGTPTGSDDIGFRSGFGMDEASGTFDGNTIQTINQDIQLRFAGAGSTAITNNVIKGGGVELAEHNGGAGTFTISGNTFNGTFGSTFTSALRLKNNTIGRATTVANNVFTGHTTGISLENYKTVTVNNNTFTPAAASTTYQHIMVNTKEFSSSSGGVTPNIDGTFTNNTFNGSGAAGGRGLALYNQDNDSPVFGTFTVGTAGNENSFGAGVGTFIYLDNTTGTTNPNATPTAPFPVNLDATNNKFDVGAGLELPTAMSLANLFLLEDKVQHKIDATTLGFVLVKAANTYVTPNSFVAPNTTPSVQRGADAASNNFIVNVKEGTYNNTLVINKNLTFRGAQVGVAGTTNRPVESILLAPTTGSNQLFSLSGNGTTVTFDGFKFDGKNIGNVVDGTQKLYIRNTIAELDFAPASNNLYSSSDSLVLTNNYFKAEDGTNDGSASHIFSSATNLVAKGNTFTSADAVDQLTAGTTSLPVWLNVTTNTQKAVVDSNLFTTIDIGVLLGANASNVTISNNDFADAKRNSRSGNSGNGYGTGIALFETLTGTGNSINNNNFTNSETGIRSSAGGAGPYALPAGLGVHYNSFTSISDTSIRLSAAFTGTLDAECNWFGTTSANAIDATTSNQVDYTPYLLNGTDADPAATGFQTTAACNGTPVVITNTTFTPQTCSGNGSFTVTFNGGTGPYTVNYSGPVPGSGTVAANGTSYTSPGTLTQGTYTITITDANGSFATTTVVVTYNPVTNTNTGISYTTIQGAIDAAATISGQTLQVCAGTYTENIVVNKELTINGPNANTAGCTTRAAEAIIKPATTGPEYGAGETDMINVQANNVTISGFTIDGDNPALTSAKNANGANIDAADGIGIYQPVSNLTITNNILKNINEAAVDQFYTTATPTSGNTISNNKFDNIPGTDYGQGVSFYNNFYAKVENNCMTRVRIGVQTGNGHLANPGATATISNNNIESSIIGIWHNLQYQAASPWTISGNTLTATPSAATNTGLFISSIQSSVSVIVANNNVTGAKWGIELWNNPTTNPVTITGGILTNCETGIFTNNYDSYADPANLTSGTTTSIINGVNITGGTTGIHVKDNTANTNNAPVVMQIQGGTTINNNGTGLRIEGGFASATFSGPTPATLTGQAKYITYATNGNDWPTADIDATAVNFDGSLGSSKNLPQLFTTEDKIDHKIDYVVAGFVTVKASNTYVTPNSFIAPNTAPKIQRGVDAAGPTGFTENVQAGTYADNVTVNKEIIISGPNDAINPNTGSRAAEAIVVPATNILADVAGRVFNITANNVTIKGFTVDGDNPAISGGTAINGADVNASSGIATGVYPSINGNSNLLLENNIVRNFDNDVSSTGAIYGNGSQSTAITGSKVLNNKIDNSNIWGILTESNWYADLQGNVITRSNRGIQADGYFVAAPAVTAISGNTISYYKRGITVNNNFGNASRFAVNNNTIATETNGTNEDGNPGAAALNRGIAVWSMFSGTAGVTTSGNTIANANIGAEYWNIAPGKLTSTADVITNAGTGVLVETNHPSFGAAGYGSFATITQASINGSTTDGILLTDNNGAGGPNAQLSLTNTFVTGGTNNIRITGADIDASTAVNNNSLTGASAKAIDASAYTGGTPIAATCNWYGSNAAPAVATRISGSVTYIPHLSDGTDAAPTTPGFQPMTPCAACTTLTATITKTNNQCNGGSTGTITATAASGVGPYTYKLSGTGANTTGDANGQYTGLPAGTYTVTATGANGCSTTFAPVNITQPTATLPDASISIPAFSGNIFITNSSSVTFLVQVQENAGNAMTAAALNITDQDGYTFTFNKSLESVVIRGTTYQVDNKNWTGTLANPDNLDFDNTIALDLGKQVNCLGSVYLAVTLTRTTPNKSNFVLTSFMNGVMGNNGAETVTNNNSTTFFLVGN